MKLILANNANKNSDLCLQLIIATSAKDDKTENQKTFIIESQTFQQRFGSPNFFNPFSSAPEDHFRNSDPAASGSESFDTRIDLGTNPSFHYQGLEDNIENLPPLPPGEFYQYDSDDLVAPPPHGPDERQQINLACHIRFCEQTIVGRSLEYDRALQIIQDEEYLSAADLNIVRQKRSAKEEQDKIREKTIQILKRFKRQSDTFQLFGSDYAINTNFTGEFDFRVIPLTILFGVAYVVTMMGISDSFSLLDGDNTIPNVRTTLDTPIFNVLPPPGFAPDTSISPDSPFGGASPGNADPNDLSVALSLLPPGTTAVAVFPPYATPRTLPAICVIYSEDDATSLNAANQDAYYYVTRRKKRSVFNWMSSVFNPWHTDEKSSRRNDDGLEEIETNEVIDPVARRLFGFACLVRVLEERCVLDVTCDANGNRLFRKKRQTGEEFSANGPPDCRTTVAPDGCTTP